MRHRFYIFLLLAVSAVLRFNGYPPHIQESRGHEQATLTTEEERTFSAVDYVSDFALSGYSPVLANNAFARRYETHSRTVQNDYTNMRTSNLGLSIAEESAISHRLNTDILCAEALVVGLPAEDISFPFNSFW